jgi:4a-hydroxytetrahydrobiopterin dehydratase
MERHRSRAILTRIIREMEPEKRTTGRRPVLKRHRKDATNAKDLESSQKCWREKMKVLAQQEIMKRLSALEGWALTPQGIQKRYDLADFRSAMNLVNRVAELAEEANHHPDIFVSYDRVTFTLTTHDAGGITGKDFDLASRIEAVAR